MATVQVTDTLLREVKDAITTAHRVERDAMREFHGLAKPLRGAGWDRFALDRMWKLAPELEGKMPQEWCNQVNAMGLRFPSYVAQIEFTGKLLVPPGTSSPTQVIVALSDTFPDQTLPGRIEAYTQVVEELSYKYTRIETQIMEFLNGCASLNKAVSLYPNLRLFLSESVKARLDKKVERKITNAHASAAFAKLDTDTITASATQAVLRKGN